MIAALVTNYPTWAGSGTMAGNRLPDIYNRSIGWYPINAIVRRQ